MLMWTSSRMFESQLRGLSIMRSRLLLLLKRYKYKSLRLRWTWIYTLYRCSPHLSFPRIHMCAIRNHKKWNKNSSTFSSSIQFSVVCHACHRTFQQRANAEHNLRGKVWRMTMGSSLFAIHRPLALCICSAQMCNLSQKRFSCCPLSELSTLWKCCWSQLSEF